MQTLLSIIIPVYNGEKFITGCLDSLFLQNIPGCEIIIINDGSTDASESLITNKYKNKLEKGVLKYHFQENAGVSVARNCGIEIATGRYLGFIDCDDIIASDYFDTVLSHIEKYTDTEIYEFGYKLFIEGEDVEENLDRFMSSTFGLLKPDDLEEVFARSVWYPVTRIYKRELFEGLEFPRGVRYCEDMMLLPLLYERAKKVFHIEKALYYYRLNNASASFNVRPDYKENLIAFYNRVKEKNSDLFKLLKLNIFYVLFDLTKMESNKTGIPSDIWEDLKKYRYFFWTKRNIIPKRRLAIALFPGLMEFQQKLRGNTGMGLLKVKRK